jgi:hypothetical protein
VLETIVAEAKDAAALRLVKPNLEMLADYVAAHRSRDMRRDLGAQRCEVLSEQRTHQHRQQI